MRTAIAVVTVALVWWSGAYAKPITIKINVSPTKDQIYETSMAAIETKAEAAVHRQQMLDKKFDERVRKATASVCVGCLQEARTQTSFRVHHSALEPRTQSR